MIENDPRDRFFDDVDDESFRTAIYARTSTANQSEGYSLEEQVQLGIKRCRDFGWEIRFIFRDEAESGKNTDRPMFRKMVKAAKHGAFDVVVFWRLDRFSRSLMHAVQLEAEFREQDVYLYSLTEQIDTTSASGRFNFRSLASAAEFERDLISQRSQFSINAMASERKWPNRNPPYGYEIDEDGRLEILPEEARVVRKIFERYGELKSMPDVAAELNADGFTTAGGSPWDARSVGKVLRNEIYFGLYDVGDVEEIVPDYQIIDEETFSEVEDIRHRFQNSGGELSSMPDSRKKRITAGMLDDYEKFLQS